MKADDIQIGGSHYKDKKIQPWAAMEAWMSVEQFIGFLRGCVIKRLARWDTKDSALQDAKKAHHELGKMIEVMEAGDSGLTLEDLVVTPSCLHDWQRDLQLDRDCNRCPYTLECRKAGCA